MRIPGDPVSGMSPTQLALRQLRNEEWAAVQVVETWNPHVKIRHDLFGIIDVLAIRPGRTIAVQATSLGNVSSRVRKIVEHKNTDAVLDAGWELHVWAFKKVSNKWVLHRDVEISDTQVAEVGLGGRGKTTVRHPGTRIES